MIHWKRLVVPDESTKLYVMVTDPALDEPFTRPDDVELNQHDHGDGVIILSDWAAAVPAAMNNCLRALRARLREELEAWTDLYREVEQSLQACFDEIRLDREQRSIRRGLWLQWGGAELVPPGGKSWWTWLTPWLTRAPKLSKDEQDLAVEQIMLRAAQLRDEREHSTPPSATPLAASRDTCRSTPAVTREANGSAIGQRRPWRTPSRRQSAMPGTRALSAPGERPRRRTQAWALTVHKALPGILSGALRAAVERLLRFGSS
ncbi:hypothetical protein ABZ446_42460 [Streptomyces sp. NPDC005813]|uniref:hypothetical protein n=1 Tax=Streptomyces sp. NPDC005813 TaxID=3155592 RepID=UPI0033F42C01